MRHRKHRRPTGCRQLAALGAGALAAGLLVLAGGTAVSAGEAGDGSGTPAEHSGQVRVPGR
ncbi:hypothetical protein ACFV5N_04020 [Streptomyces sp. NPDC059853]|uniref:hypothetical protein n=1 Tax=Streptomyces sp. NPDC059853 TaxID=3346973 RepID=UPI0036612F92